MSSLAGVLRKEEEAKSRFLLTSSVYRRCCESDCDCFLKLFATDEQTSMVLAALKSVNVVEGEEEKGVAVEAGSDSVAVEAGSESVVTETTPEQSTTTETASEQDTTIEAAPEQNTTTETTPEQDTTTEATLEQTTPVETPSQNQSCTITEKTAGTYLSLLLLRVLSAPVDPSLQAQVASLLLACFLHADSVDPLFEGLPVISDLFAVVCSDQEMNRFMDKQFSRCFGPC